jgi:hypothetical protein
VDLERDVERIAQIASNYANDGESVDAVLIAEAPPGERVYLCSYAPGSGTRSWLAFDEHGEPIAGRSRVREAVSLAAMCEVAEETAGGGDLSDFRSQLVALRLTENPPGLDEAEEAALALEAVIAPAPRVATADYLDAVGAATQRLERALGDEDSPFANAMRFALASVDALAREVEAGYKRPFD